MPLISSVHLAGVARACGRALEAERWGARRGAHTYPEARARAPALLHIHLDCRGTGDGTTLPPLHQPFSPPPAAVLPRRQLGAGGVGWNEEVKRLSRSRSGGTATRSPQ